MFDTYPPETRFLIRAGEIELGFDPAMVRMSLGEPSQVTQHPGQNGPMTVWAFRRPTSGPQADSDDVGQAPFWAILGFREGRLEYAFLFEPTRAD